MLESKLTTRFGYRSTHPCPRERTEVACLVDSPTAAGPRLFPSNLRPSSQETFDVEYFSRAWCVAVRRWCWHLGEVTVREIVNRGGLMSLNRTDLDVTLPLNSVDLRIRRVGLDSIPDGYRGLGKSSDFTTSGTKPHMSTNPLPSLRVAKEPGARTRSADLRCYALAALATCAVDDGAAFTDAPEFHFLQRHLEQVPGDADEWRNELADYLRHPNPVDLPLRDLSTQIGLRPIETLAVALAAAIETDATAGRAVARLQAPMGGSRPTLALLAASVGSLFSEAGVNPIEALITGNAAQSGLLSVLNEGAPLAERPCRGARSDLPGAERVRFAWPGTVIGLEKTQQVPLPPSFLAEARRQAVGLCAGMQRVLVLRSASSGEGRTSGLRDCVSA